MDREREDFRAIEKTMRERRSRKRIDRERDGRDQDWGERREGFHGVAKASRARTIGMNCLEIVESCNAHSSVDE